MSLPRSSLLTIPLVLLAGCGSADPGRLPPAAEPPRSPVLTRAPAGRATPVGEHPEGVVVDPRTGLAAVALRDPDRLRLVDAGSGRVVRDVALPGTVRHLTLAAPGGPLLVPVETANRLLEVALPSGRVLADVATAAQPHAAVAIAGGAVAVVAERGNLLQIVRAGRVRARARVALQPGGLATLDGGRTIAVVAVRERRLELYDARTLRRTASVPAGVGPTHVACRDDDAGGVCWVADTIGDALLLFERPGGHLELSRRQYLPGGPYGIALDDRRRRLWVTLQARNQLALLPARHGTRLLRRIATVRQPLTVAVDEHSGDLLVTGTTAGVLQHVRP